MQTGSCTHPLQLDRPGFRSRRHSTPQRGALITAHPTRGPKLQPVPPLTAARPLANALPQGSVSKRSPSARSHARLAGVVSGNIRHEGGSIPERRQGGAPLSVCRNMEESAQTRPPVILTQADSSLMPCFGGQEGLASQPSPRFRFK